MTNEQTLTGELAEQFVDTIHDVDSGIGENRDYGAGIGPHDEDDRIDALVEDVRRQGDLHGDVSTAKSQPRKVRYPNGQSTDLVIETRGLTEYCEANLFRFLKANGDPSPQGYSKVFSPYQDHSPRSFIHDVEKLAGADVRAAKTLLGIYYRPIAGAGSQITGQDIAEKFGSDVEKWTDHEIRVDIVASFSGLSHEVLQRGAVIAWKLDDQPKRFF